MSTTALIGPAVGILLMLGGWLIAGGRDQHGQPLRGRVRLGEWLAMAGLGVALLTLPTDLPPTTYVIALALTLVAGLALIRGAGRLAIGWTTVAEVITTAAVLSWTRPRRIVASAVCAAAGLSLAVWLAGEGSAAAGVLGAAVALAPARWHLPAGATRERTTTGVERALAGTLSGGMEWDSHEANLRGAPVRVGFDVTNKPDRVAFALPPGWKGAGEDTLREEVRTRLDEWGRPWGVTVQHSKRRVLAERAAALPERVTLPGTVDWDWIASTAPSPLALYLGVGQDPASGKHRPVWWDPDATDPHALIGGRTKAGKSICLRLLVGQAIMRGWKVIICDPKGADFAWAGRMPGVLYFSGDDAIDGLAEACAEMDERRSWVGKRVWSGEPGADEEPDLLKIKGQPYQPCLVILDEAAEAAGIGDGDTQKQTKVNMSRLARLSRAAGIVCAFATQRPDVSFLPGETKANLGTRVMFLSDGDSTMAQMILDRALKTLGRLTAQPRGRARVLMGGGDPVETQGAFVTVGEIKKRVGTLPPDRLEPVRFATEPEWRKTLRGEAPADEPASDSKPKQSNKKRPNTPRNDRAEGPTDSDQQSDSNSQDQDSDIEPSSDPTESLGFDPFEDFD